MGGYERDPAPWALRRARRRRDPGRLQRPPARGGLGRASRRSRVNARKRVPVMDDVTITKLINGPEAFTPDGEFCLGETAVRGLFVAAGFCAHGLAGAGGIGQADGRVDRRGRAVARRSGRWTSAASASTTARRAYTLKRTREVYETYYDIKYPGHERAGGAAAAGLAGLRLARGPRRGVRREVRLGARQLVRAPTRPAGDEALRPRGWAGHALVARDRRRARAPAARRAALFDETSFAKLEVSGPGAAELLERLCDNRVARERRPRHLHADAQPPRRDRVRLHGHAARRGPLLDRHRHRVRHTTTSPGSARHAPATGVLRRGRHLALGVRRALGPAGARRPRAAAPPDPLDFPLHDARAIVVGDVPVRAMRVTYVGELGWELYCPMEFGGALWRTLWEAGEPHGAGGRRLPRDRLAAAREGLPRVGRRHHARRHAVRGRRSGSRSSATRRSSAATRSTATSRRGGSCCLVLADPRSVALGNEPVRAGGEICGPRDERRLRLHGRRARSPTPTCRPSTPSPGPRSRSRSSASGSTARCAASRCSIQTAHACAARVIGRNVHR